MSFLRYAVLFLVICLLSVLVYGLMAGVFFPPAPRTQVESTLLRAQEAVGKNPGNGRAWAALAQARWQSGDEAGAWDAVKSGQQKVKDKSLVLVNNAALDMLLLEGKDESVIKSSEEYLEVALGFRSEETSENLAQGITVPLDSQENDDLVRLYVLKATAEGNLKRWKEAATTLTEALKHAPRAADVLTLRGWARLRSDDRKGAIADFQSALKYMPGDDSATRGLAEAKAGPADS